MDDNSFDMPSPSFADRVLEKWRDMIKKENFWEQQNNRIAKIKTEDLKNHDHLTDNPMHPLMKTDPNETYMADQVRERILNTEGDCDYYKFTIDRERTGSNEEIEQYRRDIKEELEKLNRPGSIFKDIHRIRKDFLTKMNSIKSDNETIMQIEIARAKNEIVKIMKEHDKVMDTKEAEAKKSRKEMAEKHSQLKEMQEKVYLLEAENQRLKKQLDEKERSLKSKDDIIMLNVQMIDSQRVEIANLKKVDEPEISRRIDKVLSDDEKEESFAIRTADLTFESNSNCKKKLTTSFIDSPLNENKFTPPLEKIHNPHVLGEEKKVPFNPKRKIDQMSSDSPPLLIDLLSDEEANSSTEDYHTPEPKSLRGRPRKTISPKLSKIKIEKGNKKPRTTKKTPEFPVESTPSVLSTSSPPIYKSKILVLE